MEEFITKAVFALHLNELERYVPNLESWLMYLAAVLGLLCCFFGYRLRKLWFAAVCLVFGSLVGNFLYSHQILDINFSIAAGLVAATLFVFTYRFASSELAFCVAYYFLVVRWNMPVPTALIPCVALVILAMFLGRWVVTVTTAVFGAFAVVNLLPRIPLPAGLELPFLTLLTPAHREFFFAVGILALLGFLAQFGFGTDDPLIRFEKK